MMNHSQKIEGYDSLFTMIAVEGGAFDMGGESWNNNSSMPIHNVKLDSFWIGEYPVTQELWEVIMSKTHNFSYFKNRKRPVEKVSWQTIIDEFLPKLNLLTTGLRTTNGYNDKKLFYRLPTEAEWEYTARGGNKSKNYIYSVTEKLDEMGWHSENSHDETKPVGLKLPNELGIYDMIGNVWEWCHDWYDANYYEICAKDGTTTNPTGADIGRGRVLRGGSWSNTIQSLRPTCRSGNIHSYDNNNVGFRLVLSPIKI